MLAYRSVRSRNNRMNKYNLLSFQNYDVSEVSEPKRVRDEVSCKTIICFVNLLLIFETDVSRN